MKDNKETTMRDRFRREKTNLHRQFRSSILSKTLFIDIKYADTFDLLEKKKKENDCFHLFRLNSEVNFDWKIQENETLMQF